MVEFLASLLCCSHACFSSHFLILQQKPLSRRKCAACKIIVHTPCIEQLEKVSKTC